MIDNVHEHPVDDVDKLVAGTISYTALFKKKEKEFHWSKLDKDWHLFCQKDLQQLQELKD